MFPILTYRKYRGNFGLETLRPDKVEEAENLEIQQAIKAATTQNSPTTTNVVETLTPQKADVNKIEGEALKKKQLQVKMKSVDFNNPEIKLRKFINLKI